MTEYEIKLLGEQVALKNIFRNFMKTPSVRDRHYSFNTYYLDYADVFYFSGYSLRHRVGAQEIGKAAGTELKALKGEIDGVSARLEEGVRGDCILKNVFNLMSGEKYPKDAPQVAPESLKIEFATAVRRLERRATVSLNGQDYIIEAALDDISYLRNEGATGDGLLDCVLMPVKTEHELEFELKGDVDPSILPYFFDWVRTNCISDTPIELTTRSKALRARAFC